MIQTVTYRARLDGRSGEDVLSAIEPVLDDMLAGRVELLGGGVRLEGQTVSVQLRIQGLDRWKIAAIGRRFATFLFGTAKIYFRNPIQPELITTELTRNKLRVGEGRTPMVRPRRSTSPGGSTASS